MTGPTPDNQPERCAGLDPFGSGRCNSYEGHTGAHRREPAPSTPPADDLVEQIRARVALAYQRDSAPPGHVADLAYLLERLATAERERDGQTAVHRQTSEDLQTWRRRAQALQRQVDAAKEALKEAIQASAPSLIQQQLDAVVAERDALQRQVTVLENQVAAARGLAVDYSLIESDQLTEVLDAAARTEESAS